MVRITPGYRELRVRRMGVDVHLGDLVLYASKAMLANGTMVFGIFEDLIQGDRWRRKQEGEKRMLLLTDPRALILKPPIKEIAAPRARLVPNYQDGILLSNLAEIYAGQRSIVSALRRDEELCIHADWIGRLEKPYQFPAIRTEHILDEFETFGLPEGSY